MTGPAEGLPSGDPSGEDTFARYRYQAKLTLIFWLGTLTETGPTVVYAEHIEDILLEYSDRLTFIQVKTRAVAAGNWTADAMCSDGGGVDSLAKAYAVAHDRPCTFELHLEGQTSSSPATTGFVEDCMSASQQLRTKIGRLLAAALGHDPTDAEVDDFLSRLRIRPHIPSQQEIDNKCIRILGELAPGEPMGAIIKLFGDLLQHVEGAQDASNSSIEGGVGFLEAQLAHLLAEDPSQEEVVA